MEFLPLKHLLRQHRYIDSDHPVQEARRHTDEFFKRLVCMLDRNSTYDKYFMDWFTGFCDPNCFFKLKKKRKKFFFFFITSHNQYKLLRWVRYNFNFGTVQFAYHYKKFFFIVSRRSHLIVIIELFNGYLRMIRSNTQFFLWLNYYNEIKRMDYSFFLCRYSSNLFADTYLMGLIDSSGYFKLYRYYDTKYRFKYRVRLFFYMDIPANEQKILNELKVLFRSPHFFVKSSTKIRFLLHSIEDCVLLSEYVLRFKPFNRPLKIKFLNWYAMLQYLFVKDIKFPRKDRFIKLLCRYKENYYFIRPKKKKPLVLPWFKNPEDIIVPGE